jgi:hypothetical protein
MISREDPRLVGGCNHCRASYRGNEYARKRIDTVNEISIGHDACSMTVIVRLCDDCLRSLAIEAYELLLKHWEGGK